MADKNLSKQEKQRLKEKEKFEKERKKWKKLEARQRAKKSKKKDRTGSLIKVIAVLVIAAVSIGLLSIYAGSLGFPGRFMPALTVGSKNITAPEWAYNFTTLYRNMYQYGMYYGLDTSTTLFGQATQDGSTWEMTLRRQVNQGLQNEIALYGEAQKANYKIPKESQEALDEAMKELEAAAKSYAMSVGAYLSMNFVPGITKAKYRTLEERRMTVQGFAAQKQEEFRANHPDEELEKKYKEDPSAYHFVDYRIHSFAIDMPEKAEGEAPADLLVRQEEAKKAAETKAEDFLRNGSTEQGFITAAKALYDAQHQHAEGEEVDHAHDYDADTSTLNLRKKKADIESSYGDAKLAEWFFEAGRAAGETAVLATESTVYAVLLTKPSYAQNTVNFYTINVDIPEDTHEEGEEHKDDEPTPEEEAKASAEGLLAQWRTDGGTKEAFVALVNAQVPADEVEEGKQPGLTEKAVPSDFPEMESWLFAAGRKAGDADIIETSEGIKVVYFAGHNESNFSWQREISDKLVLEDYNKYIEGLQELYPLGHHGIGIRFALSSAQKMCDEYMESQKSQQNNSNLDLSAYGL